MICLISPSPRFPLAQHSSILSSLLPLCVSLLPLIIYKFRLSIPTTTVDCCIPHHSCHSSLITSRPFLGSLHLPRQAARQQQPPTAARTTITNYNLHRLPASRYWFARPAPLQNEEASFDASDTTASAVCFYYLLFIIIISSCCNCHRRRRGSSDEGT